MNIEQIISYLECNGHIVFDQASISTLYRYAEAVNKALKANHYPWRVKVLRPGRMLVVESIP